MSAELQLVEIDQISEENAPAIYVTGGLKRFIEIAKAGAEGEIPDLTTRKGRERVASLAAQVSRHKTAVEKPGREYLKRLKEMPKVVEAELREFVNEMDALRDRVRQPLNDWQAKEDARVERHNSMIRHIEDCGLGLIGGTPQPFALLFRELEEKIIVDEKFEEFEAEAHRAKTTALAKLKASFEEHQKREAEQAELERLRREAEERAEQDRIRAAQEVAVEAERQRVAQQQQAEREAAARREQELLDQAAAQEREAENQRLQLKLQAEQAERARVQAEADRVAAEQRMEQERQAAARRQEEAAEQARQDERRRADAAAAEILRQQEARERDQAHKAKVMGEAKTALMSLNITEELARAIVLKIARREVPNVTINF
ncbi:hypothetical protein [Pseudomonas sp. 32_A]|uniref:hypothetical protein n=1 Tax=Pseudomonas sp. 32_A TaxID=2813559 RepID=UPI001A9D139F|nr:hypothetical protein [Pseudomonas sp. 32_A]